MGLQDRDWYRQELAKKGSTSRADRPFYAPGTAPRRRGSSSGWTWASLVIALLLAVAVVGERTGLWTPRPAMPPERTRVVLPPEESPPPVHLARPVADPVPRPDLRPSADAPQSAPAPRTREIYFCKGYGGGTFWASSICSEHRGTIDRIVTVPGHLSWEQQVDVARGVRAEAEKLYEQPRVAPTQTVTAPPGGGECAALDAQIRSIDAEARQALPASRQEQLREARRRAWDRKFHLHC